MSELAKVESRIKVVMDRMDAIKGRLPKLRNEIGKASINDNLDKANKLQDERETLMREKERLGFQLKGLSGQRTAATKADAQAEMNKVDAELKKLIKKANNSYLDFMKALEVAVNEMDNTINPEIESQSLFIRMVELGKLGAHSKVKENFSFKPTKELFDITSSFTLKIKRIEDVRHSRNNLEKYI